MHAACQAQAVSIVLLLLRASCSVRCGMRRSHQRRLGRNTRSRCARSGEELSGASSVCSGQRLHRIADEGGEGRLSAQRRRSQEDVRCSEAAAAAVGAECEAAAERAEGEGRGIRGVARAIRLSQRRPTGWETKRREQKRTSVEWTAAEPQQADQPAREEGEERERGVRVECAALTREHGARARACEVCCAFAAVLGLVGRTDCGPPSSAPPCDKCTGEHSTARHSLTAPPHAFAEARWGGGPQCGAGREGRPVHP